MAAPAAPYQNVAWMGGSYAPPTAAHVIVALKMGEALLEKTAPGRRCAVCIVPTSNKYDKGSVSQECVPDDQRRKLIAAFVAVLSATNVMSNNPRKRDLDFLYKDYELNAPLAVPTIQSMAILSGREDKPEWAEDVLPEPADNYFIAQGQDNIVGIMKRSWVRSPELLAYGLIMYPRGVGVDPKAELMDAMTKDHPGKTKPEFMGSALSVERAEAVYNNLIIVPVDFNDDRSSSAVRAILQSPGFTEKSKEEQAAELAPFMHPHILRVLLSFDPLPYTSPLCEVQPSKRHAAAGGAAAGGSAGGGRRRRSRGTRRQSRSRRTRRRRYTRR
jgi:nicotinic acid mononucleotide adenylyltransferase